jgi:hypothetical protein
MQVVAGVWEGTGMLPGTPGLMPDTPMRFRAVNDPSGIYEVEIEACFQMQSLPGMPAFKPECSTSLRYGEWFARFQDSETLAVLTRGGGSAFNGVPLPVSCAIAYYRMIDRNTLVDQGGTRHVRTR